MKKLDHILHIDDFYKYAIGIIICIIGFYHIEAFLCLIIYMYYVRKQINLLFLSLVLLILFLSFSILTNHDEAFVNNRYMVVDINQYDNYERYTLKKGRYKYHLYSYGHYYDIGDVVYVKGEIIEYKTQSSSFGFNAKQYFMSFNIHGKISVEEISFIKHQFHINYYRYELIKKTNDLEQSDYLSAFLFGEKIRDENITKTYDDFNVLYLFTVSGMHIYILVLLIKKIMFLLNIRIGFQHVFIMTLYLFVGFLNKFSFAVLRLAIIYLLKLVNKKYRLSMEHLDMICLTFLMLLFINIGYMYHQGFIMTFIILVCLELFHPFIQKHKGYIQKLLMSFVVFLCVIPFYPNINVLQLLLLPVIIYFVTIILYPFAIMSVFSINFNTIFAFLIVKFENFILFLSRFHIYFFVPKFNIFIAILYYALLIWICFSKKIKTTLKRVFISFSFVTLGLLVQLNENIDTITFLDVGQGDTTIIQSNDCKMVIDSFNGASSYLKNHGIYRIDYLVLTHSHEDHIKEADDILKHIDVEQIVLSKYDEKYPLFNHKSLLVSSNDQILCGNITVNILGPLKKYDNENNHSIVLQLYL